MDRKYFSDYIKILNKELVPALGCTEPIAIAFAAAKAASVLGEKPGRLTAKCSGNIIKNVMGVVVPNSDNNKGIATAAILGAIAGDGNDGLNVLKSVEPEDIEECKRLAATDYCSCILAEGVENLFIDIVASLEDENGNEVHSAEVIVSDTHTNIIKILKDGEVVYDKKNDSKADEHIAYPMSIANIVDFASNVPIEDIEGIFKRQVEYNTAISKQGLKNKYGANLGSTLIKSGNASFGSRVKGKVAAGSDARMGGCNMPVIINSGSGNQGLAVSLPIIEFAKENFLSEEKLYRGLAVSNLISIYIKKKIGSLSAFCGASSAAAASGAGIAFLKGWEVPQIEKVIESILVNVGGIICDGAKSTCAAKLATALDAMLTSLDMLEAGFEFGLDEGLLGESAEETISNVCYVGKNGMSETDVNVLKIMTGEIDTML